NCPTYYVAPFARLKYLHLQLDDYTETGADDLDLSVSNSDVNEFQGGIGFKVGSAMPYGDVVYVPELSALIGYDFNNDGEQSIAGFVGGGPAFATNGVKPGRTVFDLGLALNSYVSQNSIFTVKYDLEVREKFTSNVGYLQYTYLWG
ncbi:MAG: autotransporter outer membrane beta-barrel domain-containing protein, partial [Candidatus Berkiellales bacterium]